jgi:adenosylcobinamide kinase/adenosylcobinamide-phosphate guanylyltransferase
VNNVGELYIVTGGVRSGKSTFAEKLANTFGRNIGYIATCNWTDGEFSERIKLHIERRPKYWTTYEINETTLKGLKSTIEMAISNIDGILIDCMGMWISRLILDEFSNKDILESVEECKDFIESINKPIIIVTNEVGLSLVPPNKMGRRFQEVLGKTNLLLGKKAKELFFVVSGYPIIIKEQGLLNLKKWGMDID